MDLSKFMLVQVYKEELSMAFNTVSILRDKDQNPVPQYYNQATGVFEPLQGYNGANSFHEQGTIMVEMWSGSANVTKTFTKPCQTFAIINDGTTDITVAIGTFSFVVKVDESFEGKFPVFTSLTIATTSAYRAYVKE